MIENIAVTGESWAHLKQEMDASILEFYFHKISRFPLNQPCPYVNVR